MHSQAGLDEEVKRNFWEDLDEVVRGILHIEKQFIKGDFSGHIEETAGGYDVVHGRFNFGDRNESGTSLLDIAKAFDLIVANSCFQKREDHLIMFRSMVAKTQIDYLLYRKSYRGLCIDCKVIPSEWLSTQHRLLKIDLEIKRERKRRAVYCQSKIKWGALN
ncbi:PREDICTED: craniofacial development protein 2-like [Nicotiana attenuata]|uniref:craniofacial development protein 2-like n=1 Tax=Nicotiana attenuata TaxID=49451 RepID=UPI000905D68E|nr:PREDICTED: craniofacial development protein 2-like [Nicotiana attenuata]